jgi:hypothetical protein
VSYTQLTQEQRYQIHALLKMEHSRTEFANTLGVDKSTISRELGDQTAIAYLIEDYGGIAAAEGQSERALQLVGFAAVLRESIGAPLPPMEQARVDRMIASAHEALSEADANAEWKAGRALALEEVIDLVLSAS